MNRIDIGKFLLTVFTLGLYSYKSYGLKGISPLNAWKYFDFKVASLGMFLPLPFQIRRNNEVIKIA